MQTAGRVHVDADVVVLGAGAAGLMCAIEAGKRGKSVIILERAEKIGKKILISGGGRCNFTNIHTSPNNYISKNPHFVRSALARYTPYDFIDLVQCYGIAFHEKKLGQLFCDDSSRQIVAMLENECRKNGVRIITSCMIEKVKQKSDSSFIIQTTSQNFAAGSVVIATGGPSIPKMGATGFGYDIARQFGAGVIEPEPALVPLTFENQDSFATLSGVSVDSVVECNGVSFRENILFTHRGLSGPAILQISSYWNHGDDITVNLAPEADMMTEFEQLKQERTETKNLLSRYVPARVADWITPSEQKTMPFAHLHHRQRNEIADRIHSTRLTPIGTEGFAKAEVTRGGVDTAYLSSKTMEMTTVKGLYFIGEVVDVTGWLGGYNFQWAWASGAAAGRSL